MKILLLALFFNCSIFALTNSKILYMKGDVIVKRGDNSLAASRDMALENGDTVTTGIDSLAIIKIQDHSKIKIDDKSSLKVQVVDSSSSTPKSTFINTIKGSFLMDFNKEHKKNNEVFVKVKNISMGVRGTRFLVGSNEDENEEHITLAVERGQVDIFNFDTDDTESVFEGYGVVVDKGQKLSKPYKYSWMEKVNWNVDDKRNTFFRGRKLRGERVKEFRKKRGQLLNRKIRNISKKDKIKRERIIQKVQERKSNFKNRIQKRKDRMMKQRNRRGRIQQMRRRRLNQDKRLIDQNITSPKLPKPPKPPKK